MQQAEIDYISLVSFSQEVHRQNYSHKAIKTSFNLTITTKPTLFKVIIDLLNLFIVNWPAIMLYFIIKSLTILTTKL